MPHSLQGFSGKSPDSGPEFDNYMGAAPVDLPHDVIYEEA